MGDSHGPVWVIADQLGGRIQAVSFQLVGHARKLADELGTAAETVLLGSGVADNAWQAVAAGSNRVYVCDHLDLATYQPDLYIETLVRLARDRQPEIMLFGSTPMSRELAPLVAARLQTGLTAHCIDLVLDEDGILEQRIPA